LVSLNHFPTETVKQMAQWQKWNAHLMVGKIVFKLSLLKHCSIAFRLQSVRKAKQERCLPLLSIQQSAVINDSVAGRQAIELH